MRFVLVIHCVSYLGVINLNFDKKKTLIFEIRVFFFFFLMK